MAACQENEIEFVYSLSPGLDMKYSREDELEALLNKLRQLQQLGLFWFISFALLSSEPTPPLDRRAILRSAVG